jgi:hypothetical protein
MNIVENIIGITILTIMHELIILLAFFWSLGKKNNIAVGSPIELIIEINDILENITDTIPISFGV